MILRSYDRYGIDHVEACINSLASDVFSDEANCQRLLDPSRLRVSVAADATGPLHIVARAIDLNGLASAPAAVTLQPYDGQLGVPELSFLAPADGQNVQAGETVPVRVRLRKLEQANLYLDIAGDPQHAGNPAPRSITRTADGEEIIELSLSLIHI